MEIQPADGLVQDHRRRRLVEFSLEGREGISDCPATSIEGGRLRSPGNSGIFLGVPAQRLTRIIEAGVDQRCLLGLIQQDPIGNEVHPKIGIFGYPDEIDELGMEQRFPVPGEPEARTRPQALKLAAQFLEQLQREIVPWTGFLRLGGGGGENERRSRYNADCSVASGARPQRRGRSRLGRRKAAPAAV